LIKANVLTTMPDHRQKGLELDGSGLRLGNSISKSFFKSIF